MKIFIVLFSVLFGTFLAFANEAAFLEANLQIGFISPAGQFPSVHGSTLAEIPSLKQILSCWYAGEREMGTDVQIYCSRSEVGSSQWSAPVVAVAAKEKHTGDFLRSKSIGNPVLFHDPKSRLTYLFFGTVTVGGWRGVRPFYRISKDFGETWSRSIIINGDFPGGSSTLGRLGKFVRIKPILITPDQFLLPMYTEWDDKRSFTCVFKKINEVFVEDRCQAMPGAQSLQPSIVRFGDKVIAFTRSKNGFVQTSKLDLPSLQWSPLSNLSLPNPDSSLDAVASGDGQSILLVANALSAGRNSIDLLVSVNGNDFQKIFSLDQSSNSLSEYSYPSLIRTSDGSYHLSYTYLRQAIKHIRFDEAWLQEKLR